MHARIQTECSRQGACRGITRENPNRVLKTGSLPGYCTRESKQSVQYRELTGVLHARLQTECPRLGACRSIARENPNRVLKTGSLPGYCTRESKQSVQYRELTGVLHARLQTECPRLEACRGIARENPNRVFKTGSLPGYCTRESKQSVQNWELAGILHARIQTECSRQGACRGIARENPNRVFKTGSLPEYCTRDSKQSVQDWELAGVLHARIQRECSRLGACRGIARENPNRVFKTGSLPGYCT